MDEMPMKSYPQDMFETEFIPDAEFAVYVKSKKDAELAAIDGKLRWILTREDGTRYIVRPYIP